MIGKFRLFTVVSVLVILGCLLNSLAGVAYARDGVSANLAPAAGMPDARELGAPGAAAAAASLSGWFSLVWGDSLAGDTALTYNLTDAAGQTTALSLDASLLQSLEGGLVVNGKYVNVQGDWAQAKTGQTPENVFNVTGLALAPAPGAAAPADDAPAVIGSKPWVSLMCKFSDISTEPKTLAFFQGMYGSSKPGLDHYWRELSYDNANVAGSTAVGWFVLPHAEIYYNPTDTSQGTGSTGRTALLNDCTSVADASVDFSLYSGINLMFNSDFDNGWAWGGGRTMTLDGTTKFWSTTWEPPWAYANISVIAHEMGHGFSLPHSSGMYGSTYDNAWDVMSQDRYNCGAATDPTYGCSAQHTIAYYKHRLGWLTAGQIFIAGPGPSHITLEQVALPQTSNYRLALIFFSGSTTHFYSVEPRRLTGYDVKVPGAAVVIHEVDTAASDGRPAKVVDADLTPPTSDDGAKWVVGETFTNAAAGFSVTVTAATASGFDVTILTPGYAISGNAGVAGATLSYTDGTAKTATADGTGAYSFYVSANWSGTVTPSKAGYTFSPASKTYTSLAADVSGEDYTAAPITYTISGSAGTAGATLSYTDGTAKTATADGVGAYTFTVSYNWSGDVTPSKTAYAFTPASKTYSNVQANQTNQNYTAAPITYIISGNAGVAGATLSYTDGSAKTATADGAGDYTLTVSYNWSGTVTPSKSGYTFSPTNKSYTNVLANDGAENYTATAITYTISGNAGVAGATLGYTDGSAKTATADGAGAYTFSVSYNWFGTVTPAKTGYVFTPTSKTYSGVVANQTNQNYTAVSLDAYEPDNTSAQAQTITDGVVQAHSIVPANDIDWMVFTLSGPATLTLETSGLVPADTYMELYASTNLTTPLKANDDKGGTNFYSYIEYACPSALPAGSYYVKVKAWSTTATIAAYNMAFNITRSCGISGNAGVAGAVLSYTDGTAKTATADGSGNYSFQVSYNWSGTVTPAKPGYTFTPASRTYTNVVSTRSGENYTTAGLTYTISGETGVGGTTLSYTDGSAKTATADGAGAYSFSVSDNWSGTVTPSKTGYTFSPANRSYTNVQASQAAQNYTPTALVYTISGNAGVGGAVLAYIDGTAKTATADGAGAYSFTVSYNWSGVVTPSLLGYAFTPATKTYANVVSDKTAQNYTAAAATYTLGGSIGVAGVTLSYTDGTAKTATSDALGFYSFQVPHGWSGTVTPTKVGYTFSPVNRAYTNVTLHKPTENYTANPVLFVISGSAGVAGATLSYTDGTAKTATADGAGAYSFTVSYNWSGTVTPTKTGYTFAPVSRSYSNVLASLSGENYTATAILLTISGNAGVAGAVLSYTDGTAKTATADGSGNYSFQVSYNWSGTVTPSRPRHVFTPASKTYANLTTHQTAQNYTAASSTDHFYFMPIIRR